MCGLRHTLREFFSPPSNRVTVRSGFWLLGPNRFLMGEVQGTLLRSVSCFNPWYFCNVLLQKQSNTSHGELFGLNPTPQPSRNSSFQTFLEKFPFENCFSANTFTVVDMILETLDFPITFLRVGMDNFWKHTMVYISLYPVGIAIPLVTEVGARQRNR